jgi:type I restriction enzyme S subunit
MSFNIRKKYKLGDIVKDIAMGPFGSNIKTDNFISKGVPVIRGSNLNDGGFEDDRFVYISEEKAQSLKRSLAYPDDLVFTHRGTIGQVGMIPHNKHPKYLVSQSQMKLTVDREYLDPRFLLYFFKSNIGQYQLLKNTSQVGVPAIASPTKALKNVEIEIPDVKTQFIVSTILSILDDKIELNNRMNKVLEQMAQSIFKQWFVDFEFPNENGEPYKSSGGDMQWCEELEKEIPSGWVFQPLDDVVSKSNTGGDAIQKTPIVNYDTGIRCARVGDFSNDRSLDGWGFCKVSNENFKKYQLKRGDILVTRTATLGLNKIIEKDIDAVYNNGLIRLKIDKSNNPIFIYYVINTEDFKFYIKRIDGESSTRPNMKIDYLLKYSFICPNKIIQDEFVLIVGSLKEKIQVNIEKKLVLSNLRDTLLPKLMSGEIDVSQIEL